MTDIITRDIAEGEIFKCHGPTIIEGNIGKGAEVRGTHGDLHITGNVGDKVYIKLKIGLRKPGTSVGYIFGMYSRMPVRTNGGMIVKGDDVSSDLSACVLTIDGTVGNHVELNSAGSIRLNKSTGSHLKAKAQNEIIATDIGPYADLSCRGNLTAISMGSRSKAKVGGSANIAIILDRNTVTAGNRVNTLTVNAGSHINANEIIAEGVHDKAKLKAKKLTHN